MPAPAVNLTEPRRLGSHPPGGGSSFYAVVISRGAQVDKLMACVCLSAPRRRRWRAGAPALPSRPIIHSNWCLVRGAFSVIFFALKTCFDFQG
jgi:hypothetical protein